MFGMFGMLKMFGMFWMFEDVGTLRMLGMCWDVYIYIYVCMMPSQARDHTP